jgi:hypothetical protein
MPKMMLKKVSKVMFRLSVLPIRFGASWRVMARGVPPVFLFSDKLMMLTGKPKDICQGSRGGKPEVSIWNGSHD